ncbi:MAG: hypothetical protein VX346_11200 [Planctomycetota bacterium]|nr:hypothetical protein [Planctomycetota bacterium]
MSWLLWNDCGARGTGLVHLIGHTGLSGLYLNGNPLRTTGMKNIAKLVNLKELGLGSTGITDDELVFLADLNQLTALDLSFTNITDAGLIHLGTLSTLQTLDLGYIPGRTDVPPAIGGTVVVWREGVDNGAFGYLIMGVGMGAAIIKYPFVTPQTVQILGMKNGILLGRIIGTLLVLTGIVLFVVCNWLV